MQKQKSSEETHISNFKFIITPTNAFFQLPNQHKIALFLQKGSLILILGMQTLGSLKQHIPIMKKNATTYNFDTHTTQMTFRIINQKSLNYRWTIYKVFEGDQLQEIESMQFSISNFWKNFIHEYEKNLTSLNLRTKQDKDHKKLLQTWKQIKELSKQNNVQLRVNSKKDDFKLNFVIEAKSILDQQLEQYEKQKSLRRQRQLERSQIRKSALNATYPGMEEDKIDEFLSPEKMKKTKTTEEINHVISNFSSPGKNLFTIQQQKQSIIKNLPIKRVNTIQKKISLEDLQSSLKLQSQNGGSLKRIESFEKQELSLSSKLKHERKVSLIEQKKEESLQSVKMTILYIILGLIMLWVLYNLMHHTPKVQYSNK